MAAQNGHDECIRFLVNECEVDVDSPKNDGATTMFIAAQNGHAHTCTVLAELGGKVDERFSRTTPVHIAATHQHLPTIKALHLAGSRADPEEWLPDLGDLDRPALYWSFLRWAQSVIEEPWALLSPYKRKECGVCALPTKGRVCGRCKMISYCSDACQRQNWASHKVDERYAALCRRCVVVRCSGSTCGPCSREQPLRSAHPYIPARSNASLDVARSSTLRRLWPRYNK
jgi:hypothetical protein